MIGPTHLDQAWIKAHIPGRQWRRGMALYMLGRFLRRVLPLRHRCTTCPSSSNGGNVPPGQTLMWQAPTF